MRPSRYLFTLLAIFVVLLGIVLIGGKGSLSNRFKPKLGLDLIGGTTLNLVAKPQPGQKINAADLETARGIIQKRVDAFGVAEATVVTEGNSTIIVSVPGQNEEDIAQVGKPAQMRFRKVIDTTQDLPTAASPSASPSPGASPSPSASPSPTATTPSPTSSSPAAAAPSGSASASAPNLQQEQQAILDKIGQAAAQAATSITDPKSLDQATIQKLEPFRELTPAQVALLPPQLQFNVPQVTCDKLNQRPTGSIVDPNAQAVACESDGHTKYMMDKAKVVGTDLSTAAANLDQNGTTWKVDLTFSGPGTNKWSDLTSEAYNNTGGACKATQPNQNTSASQQQVCMVAAVLDNEIVSAPAIQGVLGTQSQITGTFTKDSATLLANQLKYGALPLTFDQGNLSAVSATLGADYLRAGLIAMGIGMILVVAYAFFYYRLLGSVIFGSLILSGLLTFLMLIFLGRQIGFTLTLAGIAGFIVSLGVAADSFVIYFERLKDEIREGRSPRSAIPRAWVRARRTIITANAVTILAALVLYIIGASQVKGFAFALGLATSLDLVIVFLFRHPIMTMLAQMPAFLSPRVSGLGRVLVHAREDAPPTRPGRNRAKEA